MGPIRIWVERLLRWGLGGLLVVAGWGKLTDPLGFAMAVRGYGVVGEGLALWVAAALPALELMVGVMLMVGVWLDAAVLVSVGLYTAFWALVVQARARGLNISCGCFHLEGGRIGWVKILENTAYGAVAWSVWLLRRRSHSQ